MAANWNSGDESQSLSDYYAQYQDEVEEEVQVVSNDFSLSAEVVPSGALKVHLDQSPLIAQDFTTALSALTRLHTQFWLIQQGRLADLDTYVRTQDRHFVEEAHLIITDLAYRSPALITLLTDPSTATAAVTGAVTLAIALQKVVGAIVQARKQLLALENEERMMKTQQLKDVLTTVREVVDTLYPDADKEAKAKALQIMLPSTEEIISGLLPRKKRHS